MVYDADNSLASMIVVPGKIIDIDWELASSISQDRRTLYDACQVPVGLFLQNTRVCISRRGTGQLWNVFALSTVPLLWSFLTLESTQQQSYWFLLHLNEGRCLTSYPIPERQAAIVVADAADTAHDFSNLCFCNG